MTQARAAAERLINQMNGACGVLVVGEGEQMQECVLVRRADLELLMATWGEKNRA